MQFDVVKCNTCKQNKLRKSLGKARYIDENNKYWRSRCCPSCSSNYQKTLRRKNGYYKTNGPTSIPCKTCNNIFLQDKVSRKYCSINCRNAAVRQQVLLYNRRINNYKGIRKPKPVLNKNCLLCLSSFNTKKESAKFCSNKCRISHKVINKKIKSKKQFENKDCLLCKIIFKSTSYKQKYCSNKCALKISRIRNKQQRKIYKKLKEHQKKQRVPKWINRKELSRIYSECPKDMHVDHIIPINGKNVCGFHVEYNLQYLSAEDNILKSNSFDGTYENQSWKKKFRKYLN